MCDSVPCSGVPVRMCNGVQGDSIVGATETTPGGFTADRLLFNVCSGLVLPSGRQERPMAAHKIGVWALSNLSGRFRKAEVS